MVDWPPASIRQRRKDLKELSELLRTLPTDTEDAVERALARYLVIRSAGFIEAVRDDAASLYSREKSDATVHRRVQSSLYTGLGVAPGQLTKFVNSFHPTWETQLNVLLQADDERLKNLLGALVGARRKIAHGDGEAVTTGRALVWSDAALEVGAWVTNRFDPSRKVEDTI